MLVATWLTANQGKDKLEWSRTVDASKLETLKALMADPNYKDNINVIIRFDAIPCILIFHSPRTIYDFAYITYSDLPRGQVRLIHSLDVEKSTFFFRLKTTQ